MNCEPGDLALWRHRGVLVEVLKPAIDGQELRTTDGRAYKLKRVSTTPSWVVRMLGAPQPVKPGDKELFELLAVLDSALRPIRDRPGEDESFQWVPKRVPAYRKT